MWSKEALRSFYRDYIACLNKQNWDDLALYVSDDVTHNDKLFGLDGYREMLVNDYRTIPDLQFKIELLMADPPYISARLRFSCSPHDGFLGLDYSGKSVSFCENVFYEISNDRITSVHSIIDKAAIEAQIS